MAQHAQQRLCRPHLRRQPEVPRAVRPALLRPRGRPARGARAGRHLHARRHGGRPGAATGPARHAGRHRDQRRPLGRAEAGHAGRRAACAAAHPGAQLRRAAQHPRAAERELCAHSGAAGPAGVCLAIGRAGHRHAGLGRGAADRLFARRRAGRARRWRLWRHARLLGRRRRHARHPAVHRIDRPGAEVHVGRALGGAQQAGHRHQGRPQRAGPAGRRLAHRRAGRRRQRGRCRHRPRRHAARGHAGAVVSGGRDPDPLPGAHRRPHDGADQRRRRRRAGGRRGGHRRRAAGRFKRAPEARA